MSPEQCRAGRAWLNLTQADFAAAAGVALSTVKDFEGGRRVPMANNLAAMRAALVTRGLTFVDDGTTSGITYTKPVSA